MKIRSSICARDLEHYLEFEASVSSQGRCVSDWMERRPLMMTFQQQPYFLTLNGNIKLLKLHAFLKYFYNLSRSQITMVRFYGRYT